MKLSLKIFSWLLFFPGFLHAASLPNESIVPGGVAILPIAPVNTPKPEVTFNENPVMVLNRDKDWVAVLGIPLSTKTGKQAVDISHDGKKTRQWIEVKDKAYKTQRLTITDKRKVNPNPEDMKRINREKPIISNSLKHWRDVDDVDFEFIAPVQGERSSSFGLRRFFNDQPRRPHSGMDIAAVEGTPILAPAKGKVIEVGDFFFNGKSVFIDHGQGLITMYCHMQEINVTPGQELNTGDTLGTVGKTGRVTGAHLHWGISLNNARVDPALFLKN